jgi:hypothetical protein
MAELSDGVAAAGPIRGGVDLHRDRDAWVAELLANPNDAMPVSTFRQLNQRTSLRRRPYTKQQHKGRVQRIRPSRLKETPGRWWGLAGLIATERAI